MTQPSDPIVLTINGSEIQVPQDTTVAAAVLIAGVFPRLPVTGHARAPLCGMGICFECRVTIDGVPHRRSCQMICRAGMDVRTA